MHATEVFKAKSLERCLLRRSVTSLAHALLFRLGQFRRFTRSSLVLWGLSPNGWKRQGSIKMRGIAFYMNVKQMDALVQLQAFFGWDRSNKCSITRCDPSIC